LIGEYAWALDKIAEALLERETMDGEEIHAIIERRAANHGPDSGSTAAAAEKQAVIEPEQDQRRRGRGFIEGESPAPA